MSNDKITPDEFFSYLSNALGLSYEEMTRPWPAWSTNPRLKSVKRLLRDHVRPGGWRKVKRAHRIFVQIAGGERSDAWFAFQVREAKDAEFRGRFFASIMNGYAGMSYGLPNYVDPVI